MTQTTISDLNDLENINIYKILDVLKNRFDNNQIYTKVGDSILVKMNPYANFKDISTEMSSENQQDQTAHIKHFALKAFEEIMLSGRPQFCILLGQSGSGKTYATKVYLHHLIQNRNQSDDALKNFVDSYSLLEYFGNCYTTNNDNSSRFVSYYEVSFDKRNRQIISGNIYYFLLEKSRIIHSSSDSTNFHVLNDICADVPSDSLESNIMQPHENFAYLRDRIYSGSSSRFKCMEKQLIKLGLSQVEIAGLKRILWSILYLGNLVWVDSDESAGGCKLKESCQSTLKCLGDLFEIEDLSKILELFETRELKMNDSSVFQLRNSKQAKETCDTFAKELYSTIFNWIVYRINNHIGSKQIIQNKDIGKIGLLDIFGFECFKINGFNQFCINYCNEKLIQQFHDILIKTELSIYEKEGIPYDSTNQDMLHSESIERASFVVESIETIFGLIEDQTCLPQTTDLTMYHLIKKINLDETRNQVHPSDKLIYSIKHYACTVQYDCSGFLDINRNHLPQFFFSRFLRESKSEFLQTLYEKNESNSNFNQLSVEFSKSVHTENSSKTKIAKSIGLQFRNEMYLLINKMKNSDRQFILCIRPNDQALAKTFKFKSVLRQIKVNGLLAVCNVRKICFERHLSHLLFVEQFSIISHSSLIETDPKINAEKLVSVFIEQGLFNPGTVIVAKTIVFLKETSFISLEMRVKFLGDQASNIQKWYRKVIIKQNLKKIPLLTIWIQSCVRGFLTRQKFKAMISAIPIQSCMRGFLARKKYRAIVSSIRIQAFFRGNVARSKFKLMNTSAIKIQRFYRRAVAMKQISQFWRDHSSISYSDAAIIIQKFIRHYFTLHLIDRWKFLLLKVDKKDYNLEKLKKKFCAVIGSEASAKLLCSTADPIESLFKHKISLDCIADDLKCVYGMKSVDFYHKYGVTEEKYFEDLANRHPQLNFLLLSKSDISSSAENISFDKLDQSAVQEKIRTNLQNAINDRDIVQLMNSLSDAYKFAYEGSEVRYAENLLCHFRMVHIKTLYAESIFEKKLQKK